MYLGRSSTSVPWLLRLTAVVVVALLGGMLARADALDAIYARQTLRVGTGLVVPPYNMLDDKLQPTGSDVELARLLAQDMGVAVEFVRIVNSTGVDFLLAHKADVVMSNFSVTAERLKSIDFSTPYGSIDSVLAGPKGVRVTGFNDLVGKTVAVLRGSTNEAHVAEAAPTLNVAGYDSNDTLVNVMVSGQQQYVATAPSLLDQMNRQRGAAFIETKFLLRATPYAIGLCKGEGKLKGYLDNWVQRNLRNGRINANYKRFHGQDLPAAVVQMRTEVR